jgi:hypothetical protein
MPVKAKEIEKEVEVKKEEPKGDNTINKSGSPKIKIE